MLVGKYKLNDIHVQSKYEYHNNNVSNNSSDSLIILLHCNIA